MSSQVTLPRLGQGMESGVIVRWLKQQGETVAKGEPLYELDTEKVTQEIEAETAGVLLEIVVPEGEVAVGTTLAIIDGEAESPDGDEVPMRVVEVKKDTVVVDANHPLAGETLNFDVKVVSVRDATPEELDHGHPHEPGNGHQH